MSTKNISSDSEDDVVIDSWSNLPISEEDEECEGEDLTVFWKVRKQVRSTYEYLRTFSTYGFLDNLTIDNLFHFLYPEFAIYEEF